MRKEFTVYVTATGEILRSGTCGEGNFAGQGESGSSPSAWAVVEGRYLDSLFYFTGSPMGVAGKIASSIAIDVTTIDSSASPEEVATISNIPDPSLITIIDGNGRHSYQETSGSFEITSSVADSIQVKIHGDFPELPFDETIIAT